MQKASVTCYSVLAIVGMTALAAVGCGSSNNSSPSESSTAPKTTSAVASPPAPSTTPLKVNGEDEVVGSIDSVSGTTIEVSGPQGSASVAFSSSTKIMELTPAKPTDITPGQCVTIRPASGAEGGVTEFGLEFFNFSPSAGNGTFINNGAAISGAVLQRDHLAGVDPTHVALAAHDIRRAEHDVVACRSGVARRLDVHRKLADPAAQGTEPLALLGAGIVMGQ